MAAARRRVRTLLRLTAFALAAVVALALVLGTGAALSLRSSGVRRALLDRVERSLRASGLALHATDFRVASWSGELELDEVSIGVPGHTPLARIGRVSAEVELGSLRRPVIVLERLEVERLELDLGAPVPSASGDRPEGGSGLERVEVRTLIVREAALAGPVPAAARPWLSAYRLENVEIAASVRDGRARIERLTGVAQVAQPAGRTLAFELAAAGAADASGFEATEVRLTGAGLELRGHGAGRTDGSELFVGFALDAEPRLLAPELGTGGSVHADGRLSMPGPGGSVRLSAAGLAAEALEPWLGAERITMLSAGGTTVDVAGQATIAAGDISTLAGTAEATWTGPEGRRAAAQVSFAPDPAGVELTAEAVVHPDRDGRRAVRATLVAPAWPRLAEAVVRSAEASIELADLAAEWERLRALWPALVPAAPPDVPLAGALRAEVHLTGPLLKPQASLEARFEPRSGGALSLAAEGRAVPVAGTARLAFDRLPLALASPRLSGELSGDVAASGTPASWSATAAVATGPVALDGAPLLDALRTTADADGRRLRLRELDLRAGERRVLGQVEAGLAWPPAEAAARLLLERPHPAVERAELELSLGGGVVVARAPVVDTAAGAAFAQVVAPLATLAALPGAGALASLGGAQGPLWLSLALPEIDTCTLLPSLGLDDREERLRAGAELSLLVDPARPAAAAGTLTLTGARLDSAGLEVRADGPVRVMLGEARAALARVGLEALGARLEVEGDAALDPAWTPARPLGSLVTLVAGQARGAVPAAVLTPYLAGGQPDGELVLDASVAGPLDALAAQVEIGGDASVLWPAPYLTRLDRLALEADLERGETRLSGAARLNGGRLELLGRHDSDGLAGVLTLSDVPYRLDFGLRVALDADLELDWPRGGRGLVSGGVIVERGVLDREIDLERELLPFLLAPAESPGSEASLLDDIDLRVAVETIDGVRVRNNVADLKTGWDRIEIGGTANRPAPRGRVEVEPGGRIFAFGQTLRINRAAATFTGDPLTDPQIDFDADPVAADAPGAALGALGLADEGEASAQTAAGLESAAGRFAGYYLERLTGRLGEGLGGISIRPVVLLGEHDPSARLELSKRLSRQATLAISLDLRNPERQASLLAVQQVPGLPSLVVNAFTTENGTEGTLVQQQIEIGGGRKAVEPGERRLARVSLEAGRPLPRRLLQRATRLRKGDPVPPGAAFDLEVELVQLLREAGHADADVRVEERERRPDRVELVAHVVPGPRVELRFAGDRLPAATRRALPMLYSSGALESAALEEMRRAVRRRLLAGGHPRPEVTVAAGDGPDGRVVTITVAAGPKRPVRELRFAGLPADDAAELGRRFGPVERAELAAGEKAALARVLDGLHALGYPAATVHAHRFDEAAGRVEIEVAPGPVVRLGAVDVIGLDGERAASARARLGTAGDPAAPARLARAALDVEADLRAAGHPEARVRLVSTPAADGLVTDVRLEVAAGPAVRLDDVRFDGLRRTDAAWATRVAGLEPGAPLAPTELDRARARLLGTGLFSSVRVRSEHEQSAGRAIVEAVERAPLSLRYGVRWESGAGVGAVVDVTDRNLFGRALLGGVRLMFRAGESGGEPDRRVRAYLEAPRLGLGSLHVFAEGRRRQISSLDIEERLEASLQLSVPLGRSSALNLYGRYADTHLFEADPDPFFPFDVRIRHPYLGVAALRDTRSDPVDPRRGALASLDVSGSDDVIGSDYRYLRAFGQLYTFAPVALLGRDVTWAQAVRAGVARAFGGQSLLPDRNVRFFAGGPYSVRGYGEESLGPLDFTGSPTGGEATLVVNEELRVPVWGPLVGVAFFDVGGVWASRSDFGRDLARSIGLGLRISTPLGLLRLDAARPLDRRPGDDAYRFSVGLGNAF